MTCLQSGAGGGSLELQPGSYSTRRHLGPSPGLWLQGREVEEGLGVQLQACLGLCVCMCVCGSKSVCLCMFTSVERSSQHPWSSPALPCILGNLITPSAVSLSSASSP